MPQIEARRKQRRGQVHASIVRITVKYSSKFESWNIKKLFNSITRDRFRVSLCAIRAEIKERKIGISIDRIVAFEAGRANTACTRVGGQNSKLGHDSRGIRQNGPRVSQSSVKAPRLFAYAASIAVRNRPFKFRN